MTDEELAEQLWVVWNPKGEPLDKHPETRLLWIQMARRAQLLCGVSPDLREALEYIAARIDYAHRRAYCMDKDGERLSDAEARIDGGTTNSIRLAHAVMFGGMGSFWDRLHAAFEAARTGEVAPPCVPKCVECDKPAELERFPICRDCFGSDVISPDPNRHWHKDGSSDTDPKCHRARVQFPKDWKHTDEPLVCGDVVRLKSGGPAMTVVAMLECRNGLQTSISGVPGSTQTTIGEPYMRVSCDYYCNMSGDFRTREFSPEVLVRDAIEAKYAMETK